MRRLAGNVVVRDSNGDPRLFVAGDDVPPWAAALMGDHVWEEVDDAPPAVDLPRNLEDEADSEPAGLEHNDQGDGEPVEGGQGEVRRPPAAGRGASADAWRAYAAAVGVAVPDGAGRDEIVAAVTAAGY